MDFKAVEKKWQAEWQKKKAFKSIEDPKKKKFYALEMYPYPSASFLHMGHVRNFTIGDVVARYKRMQGFNVLYPMGYDSFGLPAENAAKKEGIHPKTYAESSIKKIMEYQKALGNSYDWDRVLASHDPEYYKWNQYFFLKLFEKGLAYRKKAPVNWCNNCETVLANEEVENGKCWRCDNEVVKKDLEQWFFKITDYADRLLKDLDKVEWPEKIKLMQKNWIGKSEGVTINFRIDNEIFPVFTTRPDTIFGVTFVVISAKHKRLLELTDKKHLKEVSEFIKKCEKQNQDDETAEKEGVFIGKYAVNPLTKEKVPVYAGNFVLAEYGSGMVMSVPAHDQRDFEFAEKYKLPAKIVICTEYPAKKCPILKEAYTGEGHLIESGKFTGLKNEAAKVEIANYIEKNKLGKKTTHYKIRDWLISRQRYWGTPIPIIYCDKCGVVGVNEKDLPVKLPEKVDFKAKVSPLTSNKEFLNVKCPKCKGNAKRETDTMGGFVDSSWYFLRYCDNKNGKMPFDKKKVNYWMPVDQYIGGAEHAVMHLMYARFFIKALKDLGYVDFDEPFMRLFNQGIVYKNGVRMSKSKGNVVYQTDVSDKYGIDTARLFLMFVSSPDKNMEWSDQGIEGSSRFLNRMIRMKENLHAKPDKRNESKIHSTIKKVTESLESFEYPRAIVALFEAGDYFSEQISKEHYEILLKLLNPFAPHITEELWHDIGNKDFISLSKWPKHDENKIDENSEALDKFIENARADIINILKLTNIKPKKIKLFVSEDWKYGIFEKLSKEESRDFKAILKKVMDPKHGEETVKIVTSFCKGNLKTDSFTDQKNEMKILKEIKTSLEKEFNAQIEIIKAEDSKEQKAKNAMPGKVAILLE